MKCLKTHCNSLALFVSLFMLLFPAKNAFSTSKEILYFNFNEIQNDTVFDLSGNNLHGKVEGPILVADGKEGKALSFDGLDNRVVVAYNPLFNFSTESFTVEAWIKTTQTSYGSVVRNHISYGYNLCINNGIAGFGIDAGHPGGIGASGTTAINDGEWHHLMGIRDRSDSTVKLYVDGELDAQTSDDRGSISSSTDLWVGGKPNAKYFFEGIIDEVELWDYAKIPVEESFCDDFNDGDYDGWTVLEGSWDIATPGFDGDPGALQSTTSNYNVIRANTTAGFGVYEYHTRVDAGFYDSIIRINYQNDSNYVHVKLHAPGDSPDRISVWKDGVRTILTEVDEGLKAGVWSHVRIERWPDDTINVYIDDRLHMTAVETEVTAPGDIMFRSWHPVIFDNVCYDPDGLEHPVEEFCDDFNDGNHDGWTVLEGSWDITTSGFGGDAGALQSTTSNYNVIRANITAGFGVYEYHTRVDAGFYDSIIRINYQNDSNYVHVKLHAPGDSPDRISVWKDGVRTILTEVEEGLTLGVWSHIEIERWCDGTINVYIDDQLHMTAVEIQVTAPGDIMFRSWYPVAFDNICYYFSNCTSVEANIAREPTSFELSQNYPNPFNPKTHIQYTLPVTGQRGLVTSPIQTTLKIYNILGQEVRMLVDELKEPGYYAATWDGRDDLGSDVPSGVYFYMLRVGDFAQTKRMLLLK